MSASAILRRQIERALEHRFPAALSPVPQTVENTPTGVVEIDNLLAGGLPVGAITEVTGPQSSGRSTVALAFLARHTREGRACAWIDADDTFDPESAAGNGVVLRQLLWVRCRSEGTTGRRKPWSRLEQAIRATDLLLQAGGFAALVLDLAGIFPEHAGRIPLATWFRFRQAAARTRCSLVVLGQAPYAQSSAAAVLACAPLTARAAGSNVLDRFTFAIRRERSTASNRAQRADPGFGGRKPPVSVWPTACSWDTEKHA